MLRYKKISNNRVRSKDVERRVLETKCILNTTPCQFTRSKTERAKEYTRKLYKKLIISNCEITSKTFPIILIYTNKSLLETKQWKGRFSNNTSLNVYILSSDKDSDFKNYRDILAKIREARDISEMPNVIIMCSHEKRITDTERLLEDCLRNPVSKYKVSSFDSDMSDTSDFSYENELLTFNINYIMMFDEADKAHNISIFAKIWKHKYFRRSRRGRLAIKEIHLITATPSYRFWERLYELNIYIIYNLRKKFKDTFDIDYELYRKIEDHDLIFIKDNYNNPIKYAENILRKIYNEPGVKTVFAPAALEKSSHIEMEKMAIKYGYIVLMINGDNKSFSSLPKYYGRVSINKFNKNMFGRGMVIYELRDTLRKFRQLYPNKNLLITGMSCIERGITFITDGNQISHAIYSNKLLDGVFGNEGNIVQFLGRCNGHKRYVGKLKIYIDPHTYKKAKNEMEHLLKIHRSDKKYFVTSQLCK